jgi:hypothetical protein
VFNYIEGEEFKSLNLGRSEEQLASCGFSGYPAFDRKRVPAKGFREQVLQAFLRRVPTAKRSDFDAYLAHHRVKPVEPLSAFSLLGVTEAHLPSDGFSLIDPLDPAATTVDFVFEIAGFRHLASGVPELRLGEKLALVPEPNNRWDRSAVQVVARDECIGYVNRLQAVTVQHWLSTRAVECCIVRLNGSLASPRAYAFTRVRSVAKAVAA